MDEQIFDLYNGTVKVRKTFTAYGHAYWLIHDKKAIKPMKRLTGVTSFTGKVFDKSDSLIGWALELATDYLERHRDELRDKKLDLAEVFEEAKKESERQKERAATIGKAVHAWIEAHAKGESPDMPDDPKVLTGVMGFVEWAEENKVEFLWTERVVYSRKYGYVGTADTGIRIKAGPLKGKTLLGDYKVSNGLYTPVRLQTAAYQGAITEENPKEVFDGRLAIRICAETEEEYTVRMEKKWSKKGYKSEIPPYLTFEAKFFDAACYADDYKQAMNAWAMIKWNKVAEAEMFQRAK